MRENLSLSVHAGVSGEKRDRKSRRKLLLNILFDSSESSDPVNRFLYFLFPTFFFIS